MINVCFSQMSQGVGHRYASPCQIKPIEGLLTSDALRRSKFQSEAYLIRKNALQSWSTDNVTPRGLLWSTIRSFWICKSRFVGWGKMLTGVICHRKNFGIASICLNPQSVNWSGLRKTINFCSTKSIGIVTSGSLLTRLRCSRNHCVRNIVKFNLYGKSVGQLLAANSVMAQFGR
jgi:hypothetical protein